MTDLAQRGPIGAKPPKAVERPDYLEAVRALPCCICQAFGLVQTSPTTAHHVIHGRYSKKRTPDVMAIPLCDGHHQGLWDTSKVALHGEPDRWRKLYGLDTDYTAPTQDKLSHLLEDT